MLPGRRNLAILLCLGPLLPQAGASLLFYRGKVVMEDGSEPGASVLIERTCYGMRERAEVTTNKKGEYTWRADLDPFAITTAMNCLLLASRPGYFSSTIDLNDPKLIGNPQLPVITLTKKTADPSLNTHNENVPRSAQKAWELGSKALEEKKWFDAERQFQAVVAAAPRFAAGWTALGMVLRVDDKLPEARKALEKAAALDPKNPLPPFWLVKVTMAQMDWEAAGKAADALLRLDTKGRYMSTAIDAAIIRYHLKDLEGAQASVAAVIQKDKKREYPQAEYVLGLILEARKEYTGAAEHLRKYLELEPKSSQAATVPARIENLGKPESASVEAALDAAGTTVPVSEEAWVPGGLKAFAKIAHLSQVPTYSNFFLEYCRQLTLETTPSNDEALPDYPGTILAYVNSVSELVHLGEQGDEGNVVTLSLATEAQRKKTEQILPLLGWKLVLSDGTLSVEPGDRPTDVLRQPVPSALGIDEITMQETLEAGGTFRFTVPSETARMEGAAAWSELMRGLPPMPGGFVELFAHDVRTAHVFAGLSAMSPDAAAVVRKTLGLRELIGQDGTKLARFGGAFALSQGAVVLPGGKEAQSGWQKVAGANPSDPPAFFRALLNKDHGRLAEFYYVLSQADAAHQRFFSSSPARLERFYGWYRDSSEVYRGMDRNLGSWRPDFLRNLPLDATGHVRFPGGKRAWPGLQEAGDDTLTELTYAEGLVPLAQFEETRKAPLDEASAGLLAEHYGEWKALLPYFEKLPGLGPDDFKALLNFSDAVSRARPATRNSLLGEWHSLVQLIVMGVRAGSLDPARASQSFRKVCEGLTASDHSAKALASLREIVAGISGPGSATASPVDLDEAVTHGLLRLTGDRRAAFDRIRELQQAPRLDTAAARDPALTAAALSGMVYGATLDPKQLLVSEDPNLLSKHRFVLDTDMRRVPLFPPSGLATSSAAPGSHLIGGFANIDSVVRNLARSGKGPPGPVITSGAGEPTLGPAVPEKLEDGPASPSTETVFRANGRLVEVHAIVTDDRGRYVDDLPEGTFTITEEGKPLHTVAFETRMAPVSVTLLFDTTGSMQAALPALRNAALKLIGELRPIDSVAVYSFNDTVTELQSFTTDKSAAKRAVMRTHAFGTTALYDALVRVNLDLVGRPGKKVIVVFTDGADNASVLTTEMATLRAKAAGIPIYTIAQGSALNSPALLKQLGGVSKSTGGVAFAIRSPSEIRAVFEAVSQDLMHGYLITFQPPPAEGHTWHGIEVQLKSMKGRKVRAREGYFPE